MNEMSTRPRNLCCAIAVTGLIMFVIGCLVAKNGNCSVMGVGSAASLMVFLFGLVGAGRCAFARRQKNEEVAAAEFRSEHGSNELFDDADEAVRMATRANIQYIKYFVPIFTIVSGVLLGIYCLILWRIWKGMEAFPIAPNPMPLALLCIFTWIGSLIVGSYFAGASREPGCRWLRPASAWLFFSGLLFLAASVALFLEYFKKATETADITVAKAGLVILSILAIELILGFVIEFYRLRMPGEEERPLIESRLLALFTEPGGVARNVAASLDYQFGFRVSEVWFYRFLERTVVPLLVAMVILLWLQTCLVVIGSEEQGIHERFGRVENKEPLQPGMYFKLPWPLAQIKRFPVEEVQEIELGEAHEEHEEEEEEEEEDDGHGHGHAPKKKKKEHHDERVILWSVGHGDSEGENNYIVARHSEKAQPRKDGKTAEKDASLSLGVLTAHIPMYFKVRNLYDFSYRHDDSLAMLRNLATRELLLYLSSVDMMDVLGPKRADATSVLKERIQAAVDEVELGVEILFVSLAGLHPPTPVGPLFDNVVSAHEAYNETILNAQADAVREEPAAHARAAQLVNQAESYKHERANVPKAEADRFLGQLKSYQSSPDVFKLYSFLNVMKEAGAKSRKYVLAENFGQEVLILNLEKKMKSSLLDLNLGDNPDEKKQ